MGTYGGSNRLLTAREVGELLGRPERTVRDNWQAWGLPSIKQGRARRFRERDVLAYIDRCEVQ
jgi:excisionase family DNA binding protein